VNVANGSKSNGVIIVSMGKPRLPFIGNRGSINRANQGENSELIQMGNRGQVRAYKLELEQTIDQSRSILKLGDDWDGEGSPGYSRATWERAVSFLHRNLDSWSGYAVPPLPHIDPGPGGAIDIDWRAPRRELLITIPAQEDTPAEFYGDNRSGEALKGFLDLTADNQWLVQWLIR
jgi:hypothetical protein